MAALPQAVAAPLPADLIDLDTPVTSVTPGRVRTQAGDIRCRAVVVAVDPPAATTLLPTLAPVRMHSYTTYYHSAPEAPLNEPILLVDGDRRELVANTVVVSRAVRRTPRRTAPDRHLGGRPDGPARADDPGRTGPAVRPLHRGLGPPDHGVGAARPARRATATGAAAQAGGPRRRPLRRR